jgi:glycosyltransferase involved in cell wall biosynthesis
MKKIQLHGLKNVEVINEFIDGTEILYAQSDCTIAPFFHYDTEKPVPRSIIESLACGRPVLVTDRVNIFDLIKQENCGIVFEPDAGSLIGAIGRLSKNYEAYRKNCRIVAERHFSKDMFIKRYSKVYEELK